MAKLPKEYGWQAIEGVGYDEMAEKYIKLTGRILASTPIERIVYAENCNNFLRQCRFL